MRYWEKSRFGLAGGSAFAARSGGEQACLGRLTAKEAY
jgi:hypothetical protein